MAAVQVSWTEVEESEAAARLVGALGAVVSTVQETDAGVGSAMPFTVAKTEKVWTACDRPDRFAGLVHELVVPVSSWQVKVAPVVTVFPFCVAWKAMLALVLLVPAGITVSMIVSGGIGTVTYVGLLCGSERFPATSRALTVYA